MECHGENCDALSNEHGYYCNDCVEKNETSRIQAKKSYINARIADPFYEDDFILFTELSHDCLGCEEDDESGDIFWRKSVVQRILFETYYNYNKAAGICDGPSLSRVELLIKHLAELKVSSVDFDEHPTDDTMQNSFEDIKDAIVNYRANAAFVKAWIEKTEIIKKQQLVTGLTNIEDVNNIVKKYLINM